TFAPIEGAGHAVQLEKPREVAHLIQSWIDARD
ncbi:MAG: alpha/beta hydrolase, partial [Acidimicrobiia bacterium]|nr:alpha/beta hydrolase [Acidimicrobiia bacterium]